MDGGTYRKSRQRISKQKECRGRKRANRKRKKLKRSKAHSPFSCTSMCVVQICDQWAIVWAILRHQKLLYGTREAACPPSVSPRWFSSGSWQIGGIMNSDTLGERKCRHMPFTFFLFFFFCSSNVCVPVPAVAVRPPSSSSCCSWNGSRSCTQTLWASATKQTVWETSFEAPGDFRAFVWSGRLSCSVTLFFTY